MSKTLLIIEDDKTLQQALSTALKHEGYHILQATDGEQGLYVARTQLPDLILLDIMMPHLNGFEVVTELRRLGEKVPVIMLSARSASKDKIRGLDLGADDYLTKPFDLDELLARVRRSLRDSSHEKTKFLDFTYDWSTQHLFDADHTMVMLSHREHKLLQFFLKRPQQVLSRNRILDGVWGSDYVGTDRTVDNFITQLRKSIGAKAIETVRGEGYRFVITS